MNTKTATSTPTNRFRTALTVLAFAVLATGLLAACTDGAEQERQEQQIAELQTDVEQLQTELAATLARTTALQERADDGRPGAVLRVEPPIFEFPKGALGGEGNVWFFGSGLEPGQWYTISIHAGGKGQEVPLLGSPDILRQANEEGAFAISVRAIDGRSGRFDYAGIGDERLQLGGAFVLTLEDVDTREVLASVPWLICGQNRENGWCPAALDTAIVPEPVVAGSGTIYDLDRFQIEDNLFQLRMGPESYWGYDGEARIDATAGDGIVMTIKLGDTLKFSRLGTSSSRTLTDHHLTIAGLGMDLEIPVGFRLEPWELKPDKAGEFVIDDSTDPGAHGKWLLIVTE